MDFVQILTKLLVGAVLLVIYTRATGRSQITPLSATDVVSSIVIGSIISESMFEDTVPTWAVVVIVIIWSLFFMLIRELKSKRIRAEVLLDGKAVQLMANGELDEANFNAVNLTLRDFETLIHQQSIPSLNELEEVWFEPTGQLSIVKKGEKHHSVLLIENGQIYESSLARLDKTRAWLEQELEKQGVRLQDVFCAEWYENTLWVHKRHPVAKRKGIG